MRFDWLTFILEIVNFLVLVWILKRFLYRPVLEAIGRRRQHIEGMLADARAREAATQAREADLNGRLAEWEEEHRGLRAHAEAELEDERARRFAALQESLDREAERRRAVAERHASEARERAEHEALAQGGRFASVLLERLASPELEARLIALALDDLGRLPDTALQALREAGRDASQAVVAATAFVLPPADRAALEAALERIAGRRIEIRYVQDPTLKSGLSIDIGSWNLHANLRDELAAFTESAGRVA